MAEKYNSGNPALYITFMDHDHVGIRDTFDIVSNSDPESKDNLMGFLDAYVKEHPEIEINIIIPNEKNIKKVLEVL